MPKQNRGEVWLVDLGMVAKVRPCLVISTSALVQDRALVTVVTHTRSTRGSRFEVPVRTRYLDVAGVFDAQSIVTVPEAKFLRKLGTLQPDQLSLVEDAVRQWLKL
ncbi:MAG: type II toxin-antitoxin system PemK/MazF family toxin [Candidatus Poribacteria bacterium]|nr:type II toxin-antitoxin system PemK/MazF family toxin [Candidatus Poribacteria bacterium]